jgi:hypothetical protein
MLSCVKENKEKINNQLHQINLPNSKLIEKKNIHVLDTNLMYMYNMIKNDKRDKIVISHEDIIVDTVLFDSALIFFYDKKALVAYYKKPFIWSGESNEGSNLEKFNVFTDYLQKAEYVQGIIYSGGSQYIDSWNFSSEKEANKALNMYKQIEAYSFFEKTLSFVFCCSNCLYIFHAENMMSSYYSKNDYNLFQKEVCKASHSIPK